MLKLTNVSKAFGSRVLFEDINLQISPGSRVGLVGRNGAGKSTLFKMMMGEQEPDTGTIFRGPGSAINCLTQEPTITHGNTLMEEVQSAFPSFKEAEDEEAHLMANWDKLTEDEQMAACDRLAEIAHIKDQSGDLEAKVSRMLTGLGFERESFDRLVEHFSGGWQMRINLAKVLLQGADLLLLDEPTNHLDLEAREWLEEFLKSYQGGIVVVSHDRQFLDQVVTEIAEVELGKMAVWPGNYTQFLQLKADHIEKLQAAAQRQQKELAKQMAFVDRFRASATKSTQAKSREKQLNKVERIEPPKLDSSKMTVKFPTPPHSNREVLTIKQLSMAYGDNQLFSHVDAELERGQRIFLLGANGAGKTTFLRLVLGSEQPTGGTITLGNRVEVGYFSQHQLETLDPEHTVLQSLESMAPTAMNQTDLRSILGRFLFQGDQVHKQVKVLSGGEKSRLALARLILGGANFLLLDEPTNHMDIPAQTAMEEAFRSYEGSLLCISHDRYLIQQVATDIWELYEGHLIKYEGDYDYYLSKRDEMRQLTKRKKHVHLIPREQAPRKEHIVGEMPSVVGKVSRKAFNQLEKAIMAQEKVIAALHDELAQPEVQQDYQRLSDVGERTRAAETELASMNARWETMAADLAEV
jgi:ATP-binding cassette, subfamily F, member 3